MCTTANSQTINRIDPNTYESFEGRGWNARDPRGFTPGLRTSLRPTFMFNQLQGQHSFAIERNIVRSGQFSGRLSWRHDNPGQYNGDINVVDNTDRKAMFHGFKTSSVQGIDAWYGFSIYFPRDGTREESNDWLFFQLHASADAGEVGRIPPFAISLNRDGFSGGWRWDSRRISPGTRGEGEREYLIPARKVDYLDRWVDFVVHVRFDYSSARNGILEMWIDGERKLNQRNIQIGYNDENGIYPSWGTYFNDNLDVMNNDHYLYLDELRVVHGRANYHDVVPGVARDPGSIDLDRSLNAALYDAESDPNNDSRIRNTGSNIGSIRNDTWVRYDDFDFGSGIRRIEIRAATPSDGGSVEVRVGSPTGRLIGTVRVNNTGSWGTYRSFFSDLSSTMGTEDLYFVFRGGSGGLFDIRAFSITSI